jgi:hypothetical protein
MNQAAAQKQRDARPALPAVPFRELAFELKLLLHSEAHGNQQVEIYLARYPSPTLTLAHRDMVRATERIAEIYRLLKAIEPFERELRARFDELISAQPGKDM